MNEQMFNLMAEAVVLSYFIGMLMGGIVAAHVMIKSSKKDNDNE